MSDTMSKWVFGMNPDESVVLVRLRWWEPVLGERIPENELEGDRQIVMGILSPDKAAYVEQLEKEAETPEGEVRLAMFHELLMEFQNVVVAAERDRQRRARGLRIPA